MAKKISGSALLVIVLCLLAQTLAMGQGSAVQVQKQQERYTLSLELAISRKGRDSLEGAISVLFGADPNGYATGFLVGDGLVMTAYHVISGDLSDAKKINLGFKPNDQLHVKVYVNGCRATVLKVDKEADLALLEICGSRKQTKAPAFQAALGKDEKLLLIARPHGTKMVSKGIFCGSYNLRGQEYWSAKMTSRDGYSGSPVYNHKAEVVGVLTGYDRVQDVAVISPAIKAQKLLEDYSSTSKP